MIKKFLINFLLLALTFKMLPAADQKIGVEGANKSEFVKQKFSSPVQFLEVCLPNGLKVWLMPTEYETDEILIKMTAFGGFAFLPHSDCFSGELAALIAWESGLGDMSTDQLSTMLYEHSLDLNLKIYPFSRVIEGSSSKDQLHAFLECVHLLFTQQKFTLEGYKNAEGVARSSLMKLNQDVDYLYENALLQVNTQSVDFLKSMTPLDISKVNFMTAKDFFSRSFSNPSEFVCVIVGCFDLAEAKENVEKILGKIPSTAVSFGYERALSAPFPSGITEKAIQLKGRADSITRLTFPLKIPVNETNMNVIAFATQIIEARLRKAITEKMKQSHGIDVCYEFPLYPKLDHAWISIRFRSESNEISSLRRIILEQLNALITQGPEDVEVEHIKKLELGNDEFWMKDNSFWVLTITNYYLWGLPPERIISDALKARQLNAKNVHSFLSQALSTSNYSVLIGHP